MKFESEALSPGGMRSVNPSASTAQSNIHTKMDQYQLISKPPISKGIKPYGEIQSSQKRSTASKSVYLSSYKTPSSHVDQKIDRLHNDGHANSFTPVFNNSLSIMHQIS